MGRGSRGNGPAAAVSSFFRIIKRGDISITPERWRFKPADICIKSAPRCLIGGGLMTPRAPRWRTQTIGGGGYQSTEVIFKAQLSLLTCFNLGPPDVHLPTRECVHVEAGVQLEHLSGALPVSASVPPSQARRPSTPARRDCSAFPRFSLYLQTHTWAA